MSETAVAVRQEQTPAQMPQPTSVMSMIERMAENPAISLERVEQTFAFYQKVQADFARRAFDAAFADMQPKLPVIDKAGMSHNGKYGRWEDIVEGITPILGQHGFSIRFHVANEPGKITVRAILAHRDGHREETSFDLPADTSGSKNAIQAIGSSTSYGKRYTASALLNIVTRGEDDDGNGGPKQRKSSSAAKKDGTDKKFNEIKTDFETATSMDHLKHLGETWADDIAEMPARWADLLRDTYEVMADEFRTRAS